MTLDGFTPLDITLDGGHGEWDDVLTGDGWQGGQIEAVSAIANGTSSQRPAVAFKVKCEDGSYVIAQTTWNLLFTAARPIEARYGPAA